MKSQITPSLVFFVVAAIGLSGCASKKQTTLEPTPRWSVSQLVMTDRSFVFCEENKCPMRTVKIITEAGSVKSAQARANAGQQEHLAQFSVHFPWGSSHLDSEGQKEMNQITGSDVFKKSGPILVAGRTDPTGSYQSNKKLALRRAQTVKDGLIAAGAKENSVQAVSQEPCCNGGTKADRSLRRADVELRN